MQRLIVRLIGLSDFIFLSFAILRQALERRMVLYYKAILHNCHISLIPLIPSPKEKGRCYITKPNFITTTSAAYRYSALSKRPHPSYPFSQREGTVLHANPNYITTSSAVYRYSALSKRPHPSFSSLPKESGSTTKRRNGAALQIQAT